jgi:hypothetical protein
LTRDNGGRFLTSYIDVNLRTHYFFETGATIQRGANQDYNQVFTTFGYRFDNRNRKKEAASVPAQN